MRIDVHAHYRTDDYLDLLVDLGKADAGAARGIGAGGGAELDARLALMDRAGVDMQVLSACPQMPYGQDQAKATAVAGFVNDQYAKLVQAYPDRFRAFAALPMPHLDQSIGELSRALDQLGMAGVAMNTTVLGRALVEPDYEPVWAELNRRGAVLYLHPAGNSACSPLIGNYHLTWMVGAPAEDTISVMQLITHGIPARYPDIKIINSHLGGALPMLLQRADDQVQLGGTGHARAAQCGRAPDVVRHRRARARPRPAVCDRLTRRGPPARRHRLPLRKRRRLRPRGRLHQRLPDRHDRRPGHPRPERSHPARHRIGTRARWPAPAAPG
jgi:6-methylsalicylate decarboxylase